jgi:hypothetical protein
VKRLRGSKTARETCSASASRYDNAIMEVRRTKLKSARSRSEWAHCGSDIERRYAGATSIATIFRWCERRRSCP